LIHIHRFVSLPRRRAFVSSLFPYTTLFRSRRGRYVRRTRDPIERFEEKYIPEPNTGCWLWVGALGTGAGYPKFWDGVQIRDGHRDRKSTRLNSSHVKISYAVFCLKKKRQTQ